MVSCMDARQMGPPATALLIIRVVIQPGSTMPLRAYIREGGDVSLGFGRLSTVSDVDSALAIVRAWMERALLVSSR